MPMAMPRHLPAAHVMAIVLVLGISLAAITGYYAYGPTLSGSQARAVGGTGGASLGTMAADGAPTYEAVARPAWRDAVAALERFRSVVAAGDLVQIAAAAGEIRVQFDVLAIDVRYAHPPEEMESAHRTLLTAIERTATMFDRAEALAAEPLDRDAATRNAALLSVAARQARAAYQEAEAAGAEPRISMGVWDEMDRIAKLVEDRRHHEAETTDRPGTAWAWEAWGGAGSLGSDSPARRRVHP
jgi:regulator of protease activity HflC (stomatin/prohibitin superfamily)